MSYLALYRKYRPNNFEDMVGQNDVSEIIKNEILTNKISHAYLFSGPRGTGKTSMAKIIARMINCSNLDNNCVPCGKCDSCLTFNSSNDIVEIDAASNNGVDEIRELRDKVNLVPTVGKYKVYIIDEVHMLTTQAFNALLKTLEEPPSHAIFILATTEFHKIPATVVSRCQKFQFLKFSNEEIVNRLSNISNLENIDVSDSVLFEIARLSEGGLRDAINMLDQLSSFKNGKIEIDDVYKLNGVISYNEISDLLIYVFNGNIDSVISFINNIDKYGKNIDKFLMDVIIFLKDVLIYKNVNVFSDNIKEKNDKVQQISNIFSKEQVYDMIISLNDLSNKIKNSSFAIILLITHFIKVSDNLNKDENSNIESLCKKVDVSNVNSKNSKKLGTDVKKNVKSNNFNSEVIKLRINNAFATASKENKDNLISNWKKVKDNANNFGHSSVIGILDDIEILVVGDNDIIFLVKYDSLLERIYDYIDDIEDLLFKTFDKVYKIVFIVKDQWVYEKNNYIKNIKSGKKYEYIPDSKLEKKVKDSLVSEDNDSDDISKIISILGEDVISYK